MDISQNEQTLEGQIRNFSKPPWIQNQTIKKIITLRMWNENIKIFMNISSIYKEIDKFKYGLSY